MALNSPADNVVGTVICRTAGALQGGGPRAPPARDRAQAIERLRGAMSFARHSCTALAPSVTDPPPLTGVPQVNIPGAEVDGLPVGLSIVGGPGTDGTLVAVAAAITRM